MTATVAVVVVAAEVAVADDRSARPLSRDASLTGPGATASGPVAFAHRSDDDLVRRTDLPNGLRIVSESMPGCRSTSLGVWVGVGSRDEHPDLAGVSHALEHLLFKGTATRSARAIAESVDAVGGEMNAFTSKERTAYYVHLPAEEARNGVDLLTDVVTRPALRPEDIVSERQVILEEMALDDDDPGEQSHRLTQQAFYGTHPLAREVAGSVETVGALDAASIRQYFETWYRPANLVVAAAGAVDHDRLVDQVAHGFGDLQGGSAPDRVAPQSSAGTAEVHHLAMPIEQVHLTVGTPGPDAHDPERDAMTVLNQILGGSVSSRLFQKIREERGLVYSVFSFRGAYQDVGSLVVCAGTSPEHLGEVTELIQHELDDLVANGVTEHELTLAKGYLCGSSVLGLEDSASRMARLAGATQLHDEVPSIDEVLDRIRKVSADDVADAARRWLPTPRVVTVVGPDGRRSG